MIGNHHLFVPPEDQSTPVWRYMDLGKFVRMLQTCSLFFARADRLGDPFEGSSTAFMARDAEMLSRPENEELLTAAYDLPADYARKYLTTLSSARKMFRNDMYVSCWHLSKVESAAMWSLYGGSGAAIAVRATYSALAMALPSYVNLGKVNYLDWDSEAFNSANLFAAMLSKRASYRHESEVRALIWKQSPYPGLAFTNFGTDLPLILNDLIDRVYVSPAAPVWFEEIVTDLCRRYDLTAPVSQSDLSQQVVF